MILDLDSYLSGRSLMQFMRFSMTQVRERMQQKESESKG